MTGGLGRFLFAACLVTSMASAAESETASKNLDGFPAARSEILGLISGATQNIRIVTDFLSDGEIVSALYIAQYRKVNVQVLLGQARATHTLSRLNYLKSQNIPVWLRPRGFMSQYSTVIMADQKLYSLNADLDYMARHRKFTLTQLPDAQVKGFDEDFQKATIGGISPTPRATPLVGHASANGKGRYAGKPNEMKGPPAYQPPENPSPQGSQGSTDASPVYRYGRNKDKPSNGVPTKLPRSTILQDRARQQDQNKKDDHNPHEDATSPAGTVQ